MAFSFGLHDQCFICSRSSAREGGNPVSLTWIPVQSFHVVTCTVLVRFVLQGSTCASCAFGIKDLHLQKRPIVLGRLCIY